MMHKSLRTPLTQVLRQRHSYRCATAVLSYPRITLSQSCYWRSLSAGIVRSQHQLSTAGSSFDELWTSSVIQQEVAAEPEDVYKTRVASKISPVTRPHPVVWGNSPGPLNTTQLQLYGRQGFLQIEHLLDDNEVAILKEDLEHLITDPDFRSDPRCVIEKSNNEIRSIFEIHKSSQALKQILESGKLTSIARQILGSEVYIHQSRINFKPAFEGAGFYWHSDFETWHAEDGMPVPRALSFSVSLTDNSLANGPLMIISGSHKTFVSCVGITPENHHLESLREQEIGVADKESLSILVDPESGIDVLTGPAGSAVLFDSNCMHGSCENIMPQGRCNLFVVFNSVENTVREPYYAFQRRPEYIAATDFTPV